VYGLGAGRNVSCVTQFLEAPFEFFASQTAPSSLCRLPIDVSQSSSPKEPQATGTSVTQDQRAPC